MSEVLKEGSGMADYIEESGMRFIAENVFPIEKSALYKNMDSGIKSVEFIRIRENELIFVEAKASVANPNTNDPNNLTKFNSEIMDICDKFVHSLSLFASVKMEVAQENLPEAFNTNERKSIVFVLVIKNHDKKWCAPVKNKLVQSLPKYLKAIWKPAVFVINQQMAVRKNLAVSNEPNSWL